ncbi:hypothetical protein CR513_18555 [Mucuna pruriens]|uniref:Uncharacterized protein n=1 Tax=Mucuna pruriens TaxID=157652 RepID=A0A371H6S5_MUCPR|nr:hypothetical protein CR513_18555 [Mucuna pruriens]
MVKLSNCFVGRLSKVIKFIQISLIK